MESMKSRSFGFAARKPCKSAGEVSARIKSKMSFGRVSRKREGLLTVDFAGEVVQTNNLLLKVTKRKRVRRNGVPLAQPEWEYKAEIAGVVPRTVRFRGAYSAQGIGFS